MTFVDPFHGLIFALLLVISRFWVAELFILGCQASLVALGNKLNFKAVLQLRSVQILVYLLTLDNQIVLIFLIALK